MNSLKVFSFVKWKNKKFNKYQQTMAKGKKPSEEHK